MRHRGGIFTERSDEHLAKAMVSIFLTLTGIEKVNKFLQFRKAPQPISLRNTSWNSTEFNSLQLAKAHEPMRLMPVPMTTLRIGRRCLVHGAKSFLRS